MESPAPGAPTAASKIAACAFIPLLLLLPFAVAGPARGITGWSFVPSLLLSWVGCAALFALIWQWERPRFAIDLKLLAASIAVVALGELLCFRLLWVRFLGGMVNGYSPDAGSHAANLRRFATDLADPYNGLLTYLGIMMSWWKLTGGTIGHALRFFFYACVVMMPIGLVALLLLALPQGRLRQLPVLAAVSLGTIYFVYSPTLHLTQSEASYAQCLIYYVVTLAWLGWSLAERPRTRLVVALVGVALVRYTYPLHMPEIFLGGAALALSESFAGPARQRWLSRTLALAFAVGTVYALHRLSPLRTSEGLYDKYNLVAAAALQLVGALFLTLSPSVIPPATPAGGRAVAFAAAVGGASGLLELLYIASDQPLAYYAHKHSWLGVYLVAGGLAIVTTTALCRLWQRDTIRAAARSLPALALVLLVFAAFGKLAFSEFLFTADERAFGKPPYNYNFHLGPLFNPVGDQLVVRMLKSSGKAFGGYYTHPFQHTHFENHQFGGIGMNGMMWVTQRDLFGEHPGACYFWDLPSDRLRTIGLAYADMVAIHEKDPRRVCVPYRSWISETLATQVCGICL